MLSNAHIVSIPPDAHLHSTDKLWIVAILYAPQTPLPTTALLMIPVHVLVQPEVHLEASITKSNFLHFG